MDLKDFLIKKEKSYKDLADELGYHCVYINGVVTKSIRPGPTLTIKIEKWSTDDGEKPGVPRHELRPDLWPPPNETGPLAPQGQ